MSKQYRLNKASQHVWVSRGVSLELLHINCMQRTKPTDDSPALTKGEKKVEQTEVLQLRPTSYDLLDRTEITGSGWQRLFVGKLQHQPPNATSEQDGSIGNTLMLTLTLTTGEVKMNRPIYRLYLQDYLRV